jgi:O-antigen/teichoic acid export membrane protein
MTPLINIVRLSAAFLGSNLTRAAIGFALSFTLARGLGAGGFGRWILCTAWASTLTVALDLGFGVLLTRDAARDDADPGRLLSDALIVRMALALPLAGLLYVLSGRIASDAETIAGLRVAALLGAAGAAYGCFGALFRSQPRWLAPALAIETGWLTIQCVAAWWLVEGAGAVVPSLMMLALVVQLAQIATAVLCWRTVFGDRSRWRLPSVADAWALTRRAWPFAASGVIANLQTRVGPLMLGYLSTPSELGLFAAASRFGTVARLAPQAMFAGALPVLTYEHQRDRASAERVFRNVDMILLGATAAIAAASALYAAPALRLVYGAPFEAAAPTLLVVSIGLIPLLSNSACKLLLYAAGRESRVVGWSAAALLIQVCLGAMLIPTLGSIGAAASIAAGEAIVWWPLRRAIGNDVNPAATEGFAPLRQQT